MLKLFRTKSFLKEHSNIKFSDKLYIKYIVFITSLLKCEQLPPEVKDHQLKGGWKDYI